MATPPDNRGVSATVFASCFFGFHDECFGRSFPMCGCACHGGRVCPALRVVGPGQDWPRAACVLPLGHECDHASVRFDDVSVHWPYSAGDLEAIRGSR
jgi:hypothetical protein